MGKDLYVGSLAARQVFWEADAALHTMLSRTMFEGPEAVLTRTINTQPAILTMSLACLKAAESASPGTLPEPDFVAGHSLGEYTALVAAEVLGVGEAVKLVRERGRLMQEASERQATGMAAVIGLDELALEEVCRETGTYISNVNAEDQIVIAGDRVALARAIDLAGMRGARRVIALQVSGAFHTMFMKPAQEGMAEVVDQAAFHDPTVPVISNCTGQPLTSGTAIKAELLEQLCTPVQWRRSVVYLREAGVERFYEIGPGRVLAGLIRKTYPEAEVIGINDLDGARALAG
jgi:[acyl-carrier-protein] S-malonyltransferase